MGTRHPPPPKGLDPVFTQVGRLIYNWNRVETAVKILLGVLAGNTLKSHILATHNGNRSIQESLRTIATEFLDEPSKGVILGIASTFGQLQADRNLVVHAFGGWYSRFNTELYAWKSARTQHGEEGIGPRPPGEDVHIGGYINAYKAQGKFIARRGKLEAPQAAEIADTFHALYAHIEEVIEHFRGDDSPLPEKFAGTPLLKTTNEHVRDNFVFQYGADED
ncbi:hypothetical protein GYB61_00695 [bacterium]|nr:hypothetical protein [bacterium]